MTTRSKKTQRLALVAATLVVAFLISLGGTSVVSAQSMAPGPSPVCQGLYQQAESAARAELVASTAMTPTNAAAFATTYTTAVAALDTELAACNVARKWIDVAPAGGSPAAVAPGAPASGQVFVRVSALNRRTGPGTGNPVITQGAAACGTPLTVIAKDPTSSWIQTIGPDGAIGWVSGSTAYVANAPVSCAVATASAASAAPAGGSPAAPAFTFCSQSFPSGSVLYEDATVWRNGNAEKDQRYNVVFDPSQAGRGGKAVKGWWYQPCLPGSNREAHEVFTILQAGSYDYVGPECTVWHNFDGNHPFDSGQLVVERRNGVVSVPATQNQGTESWVFIRCNAGDASGFSFSRN